MDVIKGKAATALIRWLLILLSTAGAFLIYTHFAPHAETHLLIPVKINNIPNGLACAALSVRALECHFKGSPSDIDRISHAELRYNLDLSNTQAGTISLAVDPHNLGLPPGVTLVDMNPSFIAVTLEPEGVSLLPIQVPLEGRPDAGYEVMGTEVNPPVVKVRGPKSQVDTLKQISTKPIDTTGMSSSFKKQIPLEMPLQTETDRQMVEVNIDIKEIIGKKTLTGIPVTAIHATMPYDIEPDKVSMVVKGPITRLESLDVSKDLKVYVDLEGLPAGHYVKEAVISLPLQLTLESVNVETFNVTLRKK